MFGTKSPDFDAADSQVKPWHKRPDFKDHIPTFHRVLIDAEMQRMRKLLDNVHFSRDNSVGDPQDALALLSEAGSSLNNVTALVEEAVEMIRISVVREAEEAAASDPPF